MAFSDLQYGWTTLRFHLPDVAIVSTIQMEVRDSAGTWNDRVWPAFAETMAKDEAAREQLQVAYEDYEAVRYTAPSRRLTATAVCPDDIYHALLLGIREDKKTSSTSRTSRLSTVILNIYEAEPDLTEGLAGPSAFSQLRRIRAGQFQYLDPDEDSDGGTYASFAVPSDAFDQIQTLVARPNVALHVKINIKCWHWLAPVGDSEGYISRAKTEH